MSTASCTASGGADSNQALATRQQQTQGYSCASRFLTEPRVRFSLLKRSPAGPIVDETRKFLRVSALQRTMMSQDFENRLKAQVDFPSPSRVATEIIALARDPDIEMAKVAQAIGCDPAMTAKILRIANSAFYAQRRPSQNLRQALVIIGLNAALTLALSFSLVSSMRALRAAGIDYPRFWRRALLAATGARAFAESIKAPHAEDIFLAGLLQDIGVLAIDRASRDFYSQARAAGDARRLDRLRNRNTWARIMRPIPQCC